MDNKSIFESVTSLSPKTALHTPKQNSLILEYQDSALGLVQKQQY